MASTLITLAEIVLSSVRDLQRICSDKGYAVPTLHDVFSSESEAFRTDSDACYSAKLAASAAMQLSSTLLPPSLTLYHGGAGHYTSAALRVVIECHVAEILREAVLNGKQGLHAKKIDAFTGVDSVKLGRSLRLLATQLIFRESEPDVFANNRISCLLDSAKPVEQILADRFHKYDGTGGFCGFLEDLTTVSHKTSTCVWENMKDPITGHSVKLNHAPFQRAFRTQSTYFEWQKGKEQRYIRHRFNISMQGMASMRPANTILTAFDWQSLAPNSIVVDVGGGLATSAAQISQIKLVVQDLPAIVDQCKSELSSSHPDLLESSRIDHDFFDAQPIRNASVFMMKQIIHDWSDERCLVIVDTVLSYALTGSLGLNDSRTQRKAPAPLLSNFGPANDLHAIMNGQERTLGQLTDILHRTGWRIMRVNADGDYHQPVIAVAV
ncbi:S-adenosyl-L-methionine-dependent methyltransferase [Mycena maculata]|uniref:S-adenosyl-L-methionine-dependent methyltransferase n=1 Tax=Mycena maculata TaxID=230809 RepID=A0AAD7KE26_9AGAR|nr:S-adenosyl-L-methionine-dependent methyltransferase [Mycena maculata]